MHKLYWKIFLSFWLTIIITIVVIAWLSVNIAKKNNDRQHQVFFSNAYGVASIMIYDHAGKRGLKNWLTYLNQHMDMQASLLNNNYKPVLKTKLSSQVSHFIKTLKNSPKRKRQRYFMRFHNVFLTGPFRSLNHPGKYHFVAELMPHYQALFKFHWPMLLMNIAIVMLVSGIICYFLSRYLTTPLGNLRNVANQLAHGQLTARVDQCTQARRDEIGELAIEFNHMSEQLDQHVSAQKRLLSYVSHELRSPLARLEVALALARKKLADDSLKHEHDRIAMEVNRLDELISDILMLAKMETFQQHEVSKKLLNLSLLIDSIASDANFEHEQQRVVVLSKQDMIIATDEHMLRSAIENIVRNALFYSGKDQIVEISLEADPDNHQQAKITIRDHGPGVPPHELPHLFEPFYRLDANKSKGYGLGLAISQKIILLHEGSIVASNHSDGGLVVIICLPV